MRSVCSWGVVLLLLIVGQSCENTEVLVLEQQTYELSMNVGGSIARAFNVWYLSEDTDGDGVGDQPPYLWCETNTLVQIFPISIPWPYSIEISVIPAGSTEVVPLSSVEALQPISGLNAASYATNNPLGTPLDKAPITQNGRTFIFDNPGRTVTSALEEVMTATFNPLADLLGAGLGEGLCSTGNPGIPRIDDNPQPYSITINAGDTLIVKARSSSAAIAGTGLEDILLQNPANISATFSLNGQELANFVQGEVSGDFVSFTFTSR